MNVIRDAADGMRVGIEITDDAAEVGVAVASELIVLQEGAPLFRGEDDVGQEARVGHLCALFRPFGAPDDDLTNTGPGAHAPG